MSWPVATSKEGLEQSHGTAVAASMLLEGIQLPLRLQRSLCLAAVTQGQLTASADSLSQKGLEEVEGLAKELQEAAGGFDLIISSTLGSCKRLGSLKLIGTSRGSQQVEEPKDVVCIGLLHVLFCFTYLIARHVL